jgi:hypothetical protein
VTHTTRRALPSSAWRTAMDAAERAFPPRNEHGVFAFGIARTSRCGLSGPLGLVVHVERKVTDPKRPVPPLRVGDQMVVPDVVGTGRGAIASQGAVPAFTGLHPGAAIACGDFSPQIGAVACLLGVDGDPAFLVTAGHLFPDDAVGMLVLAAPPGWNDVPAAIGVLARNLLDEESIDAALVELNGDGIDLAWQTSSTWALGGVVENGDIDGMSSQAYRWQSGQFTTARPASTLPATVHFKGDLRDFTVRNVVSSSPSTTSPGDSGTILVQSGGRRGAIGLCVGEFDRESIFEPLAKVLDALGDDVDSTAVWPNPT